MFFALLTIHYPRPTHLLFFQSLSLSPFLCLVPFFCSHTETLCTFDLYAGGPAKYIYVEDVDVRGKICIVAQNMSKPNIYIYKYI